MPALDPLGVAACHSPTTEAAPSLSPMAQRRPLPFARFHLGGTAQGRWQQRHRSKTLGSGMLTTASGPSAVPDAGPDTPWRLGGHAGLRPPLARPGRRSGVPTRPGPPGSVSNDLGPGLARGAARAPLGDAQKLPERVGPAARFHCGRPRGSRPRLSGVYQGATRRSRRSPCAIPSRCTRQQAARRPAQGALGAEPSAGPLSALIPSRPPMHHRAANV